MSTADFLQLCLLAGVFIPLASFAFLVFFGWRLPGTASAGHGHDDHDHAHGHGHDAHGHGGHAHGAGAHSKAAVPHAPLDIHGHTPAEQSRLHAHDPHASEHGGAHGEQHPRKVRRPPGGNPYAGYIATAAIGLSFVLATVVLLTWAGKDEAGARAELTREAAADSVVWANLGTVPIEFGVKLDSLTIIMFFMVTLCATCIHVFSIGYMREDGRFYRFFAYLSLFCFSMLGLLISQNILFLFIFWELVGLCSYLLIGFWFEKKSASNAAIKAFVTNRVGDFGFLVGLMLAFMYLGTLSIDGSAAVFEAAAHHAGASHVPLSEAAQQVPAAQAGLAAGLFSHQFWGISLATLMGVGLFCGAIGKSAQFPLQVWLPDAMEGPTPVSALIHAATMVAAGVYLVGRIYTLLTPQAQMVITTIGAITLTMAALIAIVQVDIKRVLAYSTLSQLGYMIFAMGVGAWIAALFHLLTHAFFKAMLFLGSGQVIAGCHHEQDMRKMGGLAGKMPGTAFTFLIAVLAISGAGIPWTPLGIGGFYSKDEILVVAHARHHGWHEGGFAEHSEGGAEGHGSPAAGGDSHASGHGDQAHGEAGHAAAPAPHGDLVSQYAGVSKLPWILYILPVLVAYITPFYMGRAYILTFLGRPRDPHVHEHAHEQKIMVGPLVALMFMTFISGWFIFRDYVAYSAPTSPPLVPMISGGSDNHAPAVHHAHTAMGSIVGFAFVVGLGLAWLVYRNGLASASRFAANPAVRPIYNLLWNKFYFDEIYNFLWVGGTRVISIVSGLFDAWIIDGLVNLSAHVTKGLGFFTGLVLDNKGVDGAVNGTGRLAWSLAGALRTAHTGVIRNYVLIAGIIVTAVILAIWWPSAAVVYGLLGVALVAAPAFALNVLFPIALAAVVLRIGRIILTGFARTGDTSQWDWDALSSFWRAYVRDGAGITEIVILLALFAVLYARLNLTGPREPEYAAAR